MFKHNVDTAQKNAYPLSLSDYIAYLNVLQIYIFWIAYAWIRACWRPNNPKSEVHTEVACLGFDNKHLQVSEMC